MRSILQLACLLILLLPTATTAQEWSKDAAELELREPVVKNVPATATLTVDPSVIEIPDGDSLEVKVNGTPRMLVFDDQKAVFQVTFDRDEPLSVRKDYFAAVEEVTPIPLWLSILPPLIAIALALLFREVIVSLFIGILSGAMIVGFYIDGWLAAISGFFRVIDTYIIEALNDWGHLAVILFSMIIGAIVSVISKNGGTLGVVDRISGFAHNARNGQFATWLMGVLIFFDDYANTLVVGNTMRPVTDRLKISREKLSYLVDSTAAPIAAVAFITTWIGAELGYIQSGVDHINTAIGGDIGQSAYSIFINSLSYSFYPIFTLIFILFIVFTGRDYGPMFDSESRARTGVVQAEEGEELREVKHEMDQLLPEKDTPRRAFNAIIPILVVIIGTLTGLLVTGYDPAVWGDSDLSLLRKLSNTLGNADSYKALLWSSLLGLAVSIFMSLIQRLLTLEKCISAAIMGFKTMLDAMIILVLAWSLAAVTEEMHTAEFLTGLISGSVPAWSLPAITFILSALVAFSTGSSWGTMAILYPLMMPLTYQVGIDAGLVHEAVMPLFYNSVACVLAGAVLGDHCSPISDTTILSSLASSCHHIDHVRTQMPYALTVGGVALLIGTIPGALGIPGWITFPVGLGLLFLIVRFAGKRVPYSGGFFD